MPEETPVPDLQISVNGQPLSATAMADVTSVTVDDDLSALSMFAVELNNWDAERLTYAWSDSSTFPLGATVEIKLGVVDRVTTVLVGEVTSLEPSFASGQPPMFTVRGHDLRHRLARGRNTRAFTKMKDSGIATQLAQGAGLRCQAKDSQITHDFVLQSNQTDLEFLQSRARLIGYEVYVTGRELRFRPPGTDSPPVTTLKVGLDLTEFSPRLTSMGLVSETAARGWDLKQKRAIATSATTAAGADATAARQVKKAFGSSTSTVVTVPVSTGAVADQLARGAFADMALAYVQAEAVGGGRADIRPGTVVKVEGAGTPYSGRYYVTSVRHSLVLGSGFTTSFSARRSGP